ncbi:pyridoxamine 5'-phosphate oxidase family protein [Mesorhizobium sp. L-8-3]|uniref:pyridoxamine 5'-phosphate oxidase family protein n=1 Tax=Mesorhizobium sp. L-8-3 TaxID=2744522 RepID=UPI001927E1FA|nr:pyridoxamine 5'-phosphate oxidase family protein [Mesorhizobium sp. L-8-3]BCH26181.1 pyridoxamine 5'-phosphate oxidase [Mesorhizobium sp. L-8-3]
METSPFHDDERAAQAFADVRAAGGGIRAFMPDQHRSFFELLPYLFVATTDAQGWPLATMLTSAPGFVHSPDPVTLRVNALPDRHDPAAGSIIEGAELGILGLDLSTRRRNRANGRVSGLDDQGFTVAVHQSFGNCPQYIQGRVVRSKASAGRGVEQMTSLDVEAMAMIRQADTFFVASRSRPGISAAGGVDISHRGGRSGFVQVEGDVLTIPDYRGNRYFNTLGNLLGEPRAGLLFIDFETGDLLQLQGLATIDWSDRAAGLVEGAERLWTFRVTGGWRRRAAAGLRWAFVDYSPATERTGVWRPAA